MRVATSLHGSGSSLGIKRWPRAGLWHLGDKRAGWVVGRVSDGLHQGSAVLADPVTGHVVTLVVEPGELVGVLEVELVLRGQ